jgi:hypothetical protein
MERQQPGWAAENTGWGRAAPAPRGVMEDWAAAVKREKEEMAREVKFVTEEGRREDEARLRDEHLFGSKDWRPDVDDARGRALRLLKEEGKLVLCRKCKHMNSHRGWTRVYQCWNCRARITDQEQVEN